MNAGLAAARVLVDVVLIGGEDQRVAHREQVGLLADAHLEGFGGPELDRLETLMDEEDTDLLKWVMGQEPVPLDADAELLTTIIAYRLKTACRADRSRRGWPGCPRRARA